MENLMRLLHSKKLDRLDLVQPEIKIKLPTANQVREFLTRHVEEVHVRYHRETGVHLEYGFTNLREIQREEDQVDPLPGLTLLVQPINGDHVEYDLKQGIKYVAGNPILFRTTDPSFCAIDSAMLALKDLSKCTVDDPRVLKTLPGYKPGKKSKKASDPNFRCIKTVSRYY